jgi:hypothetical protein
LGTPGKKEIGRKKEGDKERTWGGAHAWCDARHNVTVSTVDRERAVLFAELTLVNMFF